jgi:gas vesicle protein
MKKGESALLGFFIGILAGVSVGLLYAPEKGTHVRRRLSYRLDKYKKILSNTLDQLIESKAKYESSAKVEEKKRKEAMIEKAEKLMTEIDDLSNKIKSRVN